MRGERTSGHYIVIATLFVVLAVYAIVEYGYSDGKGLLFGLSTGVAVVSIVRFFFFDDRVDAAESDRITIDPFTDTQAAIEAINAFQGSPEDFLLPIADELQDAHGMNMAVITDAILGKGWSPDGFAQGDGFRVYRYKSMD